MAEILWGPSDMARYRGTSRAAVNQALEKHNPPEPDFQRNSGESLWRPETIKPWLDALPRRGKHPRKKTAPATTSPAGTLGTGTIGGLVNPSIIKPVIPPEVRAQFMPAQNILPRNLFPAPAIKWADLGIKSPLAEAFKPQWNLQIGGVRETYQSLFRFSGMSELFGAHFKTNFAPGTTVMEQIGASINQSILEATGVSTGIQNIARTTGFKAGYSQHQLNMISSVITGFTSISLSTPALDAILHNIETSLDEGEIPDEVLQEAEKVVEYPQLFAHQVSPLTDQAIKLTLASTSARVLIVLLPRVCLCVLTAIPSDNPIHEFVKAVFLNLCTEDVKKAGKKLTEKFPGSTNGDS